MFEVGKYRCTCIVGGKCCQNSGKAGQMFVPSRNQIIRSMSLRREIEIEDVVKCCVCKAHRGSSNTTLAVAIESLKQAEVAQAEKEARQAEFVRTQLLGNRADEQRKPASYRPAGMKSEQGAIVSKVAGKKAVDRACDDLDAARKAFVDLLKTDPSVDSMGEFQLRRNDLRWLKSQVAAANARARNAARKANEEKIMRELDMVAAAEAKAKAERDAEKARIAAEAKKVADAEAQAEAIAKAELDRVEMYLLIVGGSEKLTEERIVEVKNVLNAEAKRRGINMIDLTDADLEAIALEDLAADEPTGEIDLTLRLVEDDSSVAA